MFKRASPLFCVFGGIVLNIVHEVYSISLMAFAVSMDAFSVSLGMGMNQLRLRHIFKIGMTVGFFHVCMPLIGILLGQLLSEQFGIYATYSGGILLTIIGLQMVLSSFKHEQENLLPVGFGILLFAFSVSLDSFSIGLTLGIFGAKMVTTLFLFGIFATALTWSGLLLGRKIQRFFGHYSEAFGGSILFCFGIKLLFL